MESRPINKQSILDVLADILSRKHGVTITFTPPEDEPREDDKPEQTGTA